MDNLIEALKKRLAEELSKEHPDDKALFLIERGIKDARLILELESQQRKQSFKMQTSKQ